MKAIYKTGSNKLVTSSIYTVPKKNGKRRPVINLRWVNGHLPKMHFKMTTIKDVKAAITSGCWMTSIDLTDCFWGVPLSKQDQRYVSFRWRGQNYSFRVLPFGLSLSPLYITKLYRNLVQRLGAEGHRVLMYIDDILVLGDTKQQCEETTSRVLSYLKELGAVVNEPKSCLSPSQQAEYLGFTLDSKNMRISTPKKKLVNMAKALRSTINKSNISARQLSSVLGKINSLADAMLSARVHTSGLQELKTSILRNKGWDEAAPMTKAALQDLQWWKVHLVDLNGADLIPPSADVCMATDASGFGWGAWMETPTGLVRWGGLFNKAITKKHINYKELLAVLYVLQGAPIDLHNKTLDIQIDNTTAMHYLRRLGGRHRDLSILTDKIHEICIAKKIRLIVNHLAGTLNVIADEESRRSVIHLADFQLHPDIFKTISSIWGPFTIDLFATYQNRQISRFASFLPQPKATWVDAMKHIWTKEFPYIFPPFSMITRILQKIDNEKATAVLVAPIWQAQPWFPLILRSLIDIPLVLPEHRDLLLHPLRAEGKNPPWVTVAWKISGIVSKRKMFRKKLSHKWSNRGPQQLMRAMTPTGSHGSISPSKMAKIQQLATSLLSMTG